MTTPEKREKLKIFLKENGYDQNRLSEIFEVTQPAISALLNGKKAYGKKTAALWAKKLGLNASWLLTGEGEMLKSENVATNHNLTTMELKTLLKAIEQHGDELRKQGERLDRMLDIIAPIEQSRVG